MGWSAGATNVAVASFHPAGSGTRYVRLTVDWAALGLDAARVNAVTQPDIAGFQPAARYAIGASIRVEPAKGALLVIAHDA